MRCQICGGDNVILGKAIMSSCGVHAGWWCGDCRRWANPTKRFISHTEVDVDSLPTVVDHQAESGLACDRCGANGAENHHWAMRSIFEDCESWPQSNLCLRCHREWHDKMNEWRASNPNIMSNR